MLLRALAVPRATVSRASLRSGVVAGAISALAFTALHDLLISDIWFAAGPMVGAGAVCGLCLAWSYGRLFPEPSVRSWMLYNALYVLLLAGLGAGSVLVFDPVTTMAAVVAANEPPGELIAAALPYTAAVTLLGAGGIAAWRARTWGDGIAVAVTAVALVALLGLNVSALGLVAVPLSGVALVVEMLGLVLALAFAFAVVFWGLERRAMFGRAGEA